jgi:hypothetical protein
MLTQLLALSLAATWYVAPGGKPDAPGTKEKPLGSPAAGAKKLQAGDTLVIAPGRYPLKDFDADVVRLEAKGRSDAWITIRGEGGAQYPLLEGTANLMAAIDLTEARYTRLEHLELAGTRGKQFAEGMREGVDLGGSGEVGNRAEHVVLSDLKIHHVTESAVNLSGEVLDVTMEKLDLHHTGGPAVSAPAGKPGGKGWVDVKLLHSHIHWIGYFNHGEEKPSEWDRPDGIGMEASAGPLEIGWTRFEHVRGDSLDSKSRKTYAHHTVIANSGCDSLKLWGDGSRAENVLIYGDGDGKPDNGPWASVVIDTENPGSFELINVTVDDQESRQNYPLYVQYEGKIPVTLTLRNCIFAFGGSTFFFGDSVKLNVESTLFHRSADKALPVVHFQGKDLGPGELQALGPGALSGDPLFVRRAWGKEGDYHLREGSPALGRGKGKAPADDLEGKPRPKGPVDLGAYQRQ